MCIRDSYIPDREREGYGLNLQAIDQLHAQGTQLIITVDNGISSVEEVAYASQLGMDVVVTDHHRSREVLPAACAVVDPVSYTHLEVYKRQVLHRPLCYTT